MSETFYRLHSNPAAPAFAAENAHSGLWGSTWNADGSQTECTDCSQHDGSRDECATCDGTGWQDAEYGYSCCDSADELIAYMAERGGADADDTVIVFEGQQVGTGFDGEPLAVPTGSVETLTWAELVKVTA